MSKTLLSMCVSFILSILLLISPAAFAGNAVERGAKHIADDITETFFSWPMFVLLGGGGLAGAVHPLDNDVAGYFKNGSKMGKADDVAYWAAQFYVLDPAALLVYGAGKLVKDREVALTGEVLLESLIFTQAVTGLMKEAAGRTRPNGGSHSFPSGHASNAFSVATALEVLHGPAYGIPAYAIASFIAFARIDSNSHYLSDTVMGAAVGSAIGLGVALAHRHREQRVVFYPLTGDRLGIGAAWTF